MRFFFLAFFVMASLSVNAQWDTLNTGTDMRINGIAFFSETEGVVCGLDPSLDSGSYGRLYVTNLRGDSWWPIMPEAWNKNRSINDITFIPDGRLWAVGDSGTVSLQTVWFVTYESVSHLSDHALYCTSAVGDSVFYTAGQNGIAFRTYDRGISWDTLNTGTTENINDIYFTDAANGWIIADGGYLAVTADSGSTWTFVPQPQFGFTDFMGFAYQDTLGINPYIVGENGAGMFSVNGGVNWFGFVTNTSNDIQQIRFGNTVSGIMCGDNGYINRSEDGGGTWFNDTSSVTVDLFDIAFAGDTTAFICGDSGVVLRSRMDVSSVHHSSVPTLAARAYPNPTAGPLFVEVMLRAESNVTVELVDLVGQVIHANNYAHVTSGVNRFEVNTADLAPGIYFVRVIADGQALTMPVIRN